VSPLGECSKGDACVAPTGKVDGIFFLIRLSLGYREIPRHTITGVLTAGDNVVSSSRNDRRVGKKFVPIALFVIANERT
jgi:hypothetical protein